MCATYIQKIAKLAITRLISILLIIMVFRRETHFVPL